jgi:hypothetical protein
MPIVAYLFAIFLHLIALAYLPAFMMYIIIIAGRDRVSGFVARHGGKMIFVLLGGVIALYTAVKLFGPSFWRLAFLSPLGDRFTIDGYTMLSGKHIVDYLNLLVLLIPVTLIVFILNLRNSTQPKGIGGKLYALESIFLKTGAVIGLAAAFLLEPKLGMARDWDLMSVFLIGGGITGIYLWVTRYGQTRCFRTATILLFIMNLSVFIPWLTINNSPSALYDYNMSMMELDPQHGRAGFFRMIAYNDGHNRPVEVARLNLYSQDTFPEMWLNKEGMEFLAAGDLSEAENRLNRALEHNPGFFSIYLNKALCHYEKKETDSVFEYLEYADALNPYNTFIHAFRGLAFTQAGEEDWARISWLKSIDFDARNPLSFLNLASYYLERDQADSAIHFMRRYPGVGNIHPVYFLLGTQRLIVNDSTTVFDNLMAVSVSGKDSVLEERTAAIVADLRAFHLR